MRKIASHYFNLISIENLFQAWQEFKKGKRAKIDVQLFERHLEDNLFDLHYKLANKTYKHGWYLEFFVHDPKRRHIHKASVEDRIVHHLLYKFLYEIFDKTFIFDSYSCRLEKGIHCAVARLKKFTKIVSKNYTRDCWVLKLDIKKFFDSVDHQILINLISKRIPDRDTLWRIYQVIDSFHSAAGIDKGIPLGNLTSQIFANVYLNELDQFVKGKLKIKYYLRYADDFIILSQNRKFLYQCINTLKQFLKENLKLELHPSKIILRNLQWGIDFCGYIVLLHYLLPRTKTKRRIFAKIKNKIVVENLAVTNPDSIFQSVQSYLGYLKHANSYKLQQTLKNQLWFLGSRN